MQVELWCKRCGHRWKRKAVGGMPKQCPHCHSPRWDQDRKNRKRELTSCETLDALDEIISESEGSQKLDETEVVETDEEVMRLLGIVE